LKVIFAGGGTAGHINPALAIANELKRRSENVEILFVGTERGMENRLVQKNGFDIKNIDILGFKRKLTFKNVEVAWKAFCSLQDCKKIIEEFKPDIVVGTGGYVSWPVLHVATRKKIPTLIHEQNVFAGVSSRQLSKNVDVVAISFEESRKYFSKAKKIIHTGNPIRSEFFDIAPVEARSRLKLDSRPCILAFGGSLGAQKFNEAVLQLIIENSKKNRYQILFSTGEQFYDEAMEFVKKHVPKDESTSIFKYIYNMDEAMQAADLVVARAGAITVSELAALGKASILIPSPNVTANHQEHNGRALEKKDAAKVILESEIMSSEDALSKAVDNILSNPEEGLRMAKNAREAGIMDATARIIDEMNNLISR